MQAFQDWYALLSDVAGKENSDSGPKNTGRHEMIKGMVSNVMIDARTLGDLPTEWTSYVAFDQGTSHNLNARIAAQVAFGRDQERLAAAFGTLDQEVKDRLADLNNAIKRAKLKSGNKREIEAMVIRELGDRRRYKELMQLREIQPMIATAMRQIFDYYNHKQTDLGAARWGTQLIGTLAQLILNQPGTAILNLSDLFGAIIE